MPASQSDTVPAAGESEEAAQLLDATVPQGSSALEAFVLMQQARIDSLENDVTKLMCLQAQSVPAPIATATYSRLVAAAVPAVKILAVRPQPGLPTRPSFSVKARECLCFPVVVGLALFCTINLSFFSLVSGIVDLNSFNTPATAVVTACTMVRPHFWDAPKCNTSIVYTSHGNVSQVGSVVLEAWACDDCKVDEAMLVCYFWQDPSEFEMGPCHRNTVSYAMALREIIGGVILLALFIGGIVLYFACPPQCPVFGEYLFRGSSGFVSLV